MNSNSKLSSLSILVLMLATTAVLVGIVMLLSNQLNTQTADLNVADTLSCTDQNNNCLIACQKIPYDGCQSNCQNKYNTCISSSTPTPTPTPTPSGGCPNVGEWGACGTNGCGRYESPRCEANGQWSCHSNPATCDPTYGTTSTPTNSGTSSNTNTTTNNSNTTVTTNNDTTSSAQTTSDISASGSQPPVQSLPDTAIFVEGDDKLVIGLFLILLGVILSRIRRAGLEEI